MAQDIIAPKPTRDELLEAEHNHYLQQVTESGVPIWMLDYYGQQYMMDPDCVCDDLKVNEDNR